MRSLAFKVTIADRDVTRDLAPFVLELTYEDQVGQQSDELSILLSDTDGRFRGNWMPDKGDSIKASIGYAKASLLNCGEFVIEELGYGGPPDQLSVRGLAAAPTKALRTNNSKAYENQTLAQIAQSIAGKHGLRIVGTVPPVNVERITQDNEPDLRFLHRLASEHGYVFSVRGTQLVWMSVYDLEAAAPVLTLKRDQVSPGYRFVDRITGVFKACEVTYHRPKEKKVHKFTVQASGVTSGDTLKLNVRAESQYQAEAKAKAALHKANSKQLTASLSIEGNIKAVAGVNVTLSGWGKLDGVYHVVTSRHTLTRDAGYRTELDLKRVRA